MNSSTRRLKSACYFTSISMAVVSNVPPLLFLTFREQYGISFTLLGTLVLINFVTQLTVDLIFSFFSSRFNIEKTVRLMPVLCAAGLWIFALWPLAFPRLVYLGLSLGTVVFSAGAGLAEVLISPIIAALPAKDPDREMSKLHSIYAWGVVIVVPLASVFLFLFGGESWQILALLLSLIPITSAVLYRTARIPEIENGEKTSGVLAYLKNKSLWLCFVAIFLGGAAECTMAQWCSGYVESALGIEKIWGDIFGVALFGAMLGFGRTLYAKIGKNLGRVIFLGALGAAGCYLLAAVSSNAVVGLIACALCGFCTSMLWPGNLVGATDRFPKGGVFIFAMMAAGGDLGASVGPQLVGSVTDAVIASERAIGICQNLGIAPDALGMKCGMLVGMLFPLVGLPIYFVMWKKKK